MRLRTLASLGILTVPILIGSVARPAATGPLQRHAERTEEPRRAAIPAAGQEHRLHQEIHDAANALGRARSARDVVLRQPHAARTARQSGRPGCSGG